MAEHCIKQLEQEVLSLYGWDTKFRYAVLLELLEKTWNGDDKELV